MAVSIFARLVCASFFALFLAACGGGGGDDEPTAYCELPNGGASAFSMACAQTIDPPAGAVVTVTITGEIVATNRTGSAGAINRYVQISFAGDGFQGEYVARQLLPGESTVVPFTLTRAFKPETVTNDRPIGVGLSSLEPAHDIDSTVRNVTMSIR